jgi:hypothetical protein
MLAAPWARSARHVAIRASPAHSPHPEPAPVVRAHSASHRLPKPSGVRVALRNSHAHSPRFGAARSLRHRAPASRAPALQPERGMQHRVELRME